MTLEKISALLSQAGSAHHQYEQTELNGVYDEAWPAWYAEHVIENGLNDLLSPAITVTQLADFLAENYKRYQREDVQQNWAEYTAAALAAHFG